jgi:hypothetical protein
MMLPISGRSHLTKSLLKFVMLLGNNSPTTAPEFAAATEETSAVPDQVARQENHYVPHCLQHAMPTREESFPSSNRKSGTRIFSCDQQSDHYHVDRATYPRTTQMVVAMFLRALREQQLLNPLYGWEQQHAQMHARTM